MIEIAGIIISAISTIGQAISLYKDISIWEEKDLIVDNRWLPLAVSKGIISGKEDDYTWKREERVASSELEGTHQTVIALNKDKKIKYRIVQGPINDRLVLVKLTR